MRALAFYLFLIASALNILTWFWLENAIPATNFPVIVSYNLFWQQDVLDERLMIFTAPLLGAVVLVLNIALWIILRGTDRSSSPAEELASKHVKAGNVFLAKLLAIATIGLELLVLAIAWFLIRVNT
jgi:hypothetical protein